MSTSRAATKTTTIRLPLSVYDDARCVVEHEHGSSVSLNDLIVSAIKAYLKLHKRKQIDAAFAGMAEDSDYQRESRLLAEEFEQSDWEALRLEEEDLTGELHELVSSSAR
jgi:hypothetical protein